MLLLEQLYTDDTNDNNGDDGNNNDNDNDKTPKMKTMTHDGQIMIA